jgi:hypothetical protein
MLVALALTLAQIQLGAVEGAVTDGTGARVPNASVVLYDTASGFERLETTRDTGTFRFDNVPFGLYGLHVRAPGFQAQDSTVSLRSNLAVAVDLELVLAGSVEEVIVRAETPLVDPERISTKTRLDEGFVRRLPGAGVQRLVATAPGWATEDNGLLHARGVDDGFLYIRNGIPLKDRIDTFFAGPLDGDTFQSIEILDGHIPVEYGYASGGVINVVPKSGLSSAWNGSVGVRAGSKRSGEVALVAGGSVGESVGIFASGAYGGSGARYLDPVDPDNFNNRGGAARLSARFDWRASARDLFVFDVSASGSAFRVTNTLEQELAGQRQRQELSDNHQSLVWQRSWSSETVMDVAWYRHAFSSKLFPSEPRENDTPISASQDRSHERRGVLVNVTHLAGEHLIKFGADFQHVTPRERFSFFFTSGEGDPFFFEDAAARDQGSLYVQDTVSFFERLTVNAGLRFDATSVLVEASQLSPRIGAVFYIPSWRTTLRGSYNRLFMPPQVENLLLSSSAEAHAISPFATAEGGGGAEVPSERQHAYEVGFAQALGDWGVLDAVYWRRDVRNFADPNVFFGTTIVFPNSVAEGTASGVNARLEFRGRGGVSGFASYGNALVYQRGPINGGLFLEEDVVEIGPGEKFIPDHDQRNVGAFGVTYQNVESGFWAALYGRHESGTPLEVDDDDLDEVMERRGADLVDFDRMRVKPRTLFDVSVGIDLFRTRRVGVDLQLDVRNVTNAAFAYNFANPFSGTHFGHPRLFSARVRLSFLNH